MIMTTASLLTTATRNRSLSQALRWLNHNYTGSDTRKAIRFQMDATQHELNVANDVYWLLHDQIYKPKG